MEAQKVPRSGHVLFVVAKVALDRFFSKLSVFPWSLSFHIAALLFIHVSSDGWAVGLLVATAP
jgi:hypothetical protein